ncbi:MAG: prepilin-type N-terminal cleavage/methylation domain-containing protein [Fusobacterium sp.]|nr:prepilin-type N-terminal cleavage/methylation domain-containing protein [Fusobacterium sp.]
MVHNNRRKDGQYEQTKCINFIRGGGSSSSGKSVTSSPQSSYGTGSAGGFTMAEILLSLTIIGVVAAITLPSLTGNINERTWNTQRKALYARFSQAIALMPALNGYGTLDDTTDTAAETFITSGLAKVLKINNICDADHIADCGVPDKVTTYFGGSASFPRDWDTLNNKMLSQSYLGGLSYSMLNSKAAAFETANGESIAVFYNNSCGYNNADSEVFLMGQAVCADLIYDLNGSKGPNTFGKDMGFMTFFYSTDSVVVAPDIYPRVVESMDWTSAVKYCGNIDGGAYRLPNMEELYSAFINQKFVRDTFGNGNFWSATTVLGRSTWAKHMTMAGTVGTLPKTRTDPESICIKR